jgi:uncharacterized protein (TIGR02996 family)
MSERDDLLRAICADPDADAPRLVYADWLDEHGDPDRAAFIRAECEYARLPADDPRRARAGARRRELYSLHAEAWAGELPKLPGVTWSSVPVQFRRGFVEHVSFTNAATFLRHAAAVFSSAPIQSVHFGRLTGPGGAQVVGSPYLAVVTRLTIETFGGGMGTAGAVALARSPHLGRLDFIDLQRHAIGDEGARALAESPNLPSLRQIDLGHNGLGPGAGALLLGPAARIRPRQVMLGGNGLGDAGAEALALSPTRELVGLALDGNGIGNAGARALAASPALAGLRWLDLNGNRITAAGAAALVTSPHLAALERLELVGNPIPKVRAAALRRRFRGKTLLLGGPAD